MDRLEGTATADGLKMVIEAIDRRRSSAIQATRSATGEVSKMYYQGAEAALAEVQSFAEKVAAIVIAKEPSQ